uniref:Prostaglandin E synthase 2-like n=1 Tax=Sphaeramia orbicularis TaxID=375764 RepID=A0A672Z634_9TELE
MKSVNENGKEVTEYNNKYWLMLSEDEDDSMVILSKTEKTEEGGRRWADDWLVHLISPNVLPGPPARPWQFSTFEGFFAKYSGNQASVLWSRLTLFIPTGHNLQDDVRQAPVQGVNDWVAAIGRKRKFMGGNQPTPGRLAVFGVLRVMEGLQAFDDMMENTKVKHWYRRMERATLNHEGRQ